MIVFTDLNPAIIHDWWNTKRITSDLNRLFMSNLCSNYLGISNLIGILPDQNIMSAEAILDPESPKFDQEYTLYFTEGYGFIPLMTQIVAPEFNNLYDLHAIFVEFSPYRDAIVECISNVMLAKYGIRSFVARTIDDLDYGLSQLPELHYPILNLLNLSADINKLGYSGDPNE